MSKPEQITRTPSTAEPLVLTVATAIGLSIMGDSLMYGILALEAESLGLSLAAVGWLLSANRWIRLLSNTAAGRVFERFGPRMPFIASTVLGFVTALLYGTGLGFVVFLLARMGWGVAWSGLRQGGYEAVWQGNPQQKGKLMGLLWGIVRLGSAVSVALGGYLHDHFGYQVSVGVIAGLTALAIPIAMIARWPAQERHAPSVRLTAGAILSFSDWRAAFGPLVQRWLLFSTFIHAILEGVIIPSLAVFIDYRFGENQLFLQSWLGVGTLTGVLLFVRWTANLLFGPLIGAISDRLGQTRTIVLLSTGALLALIAAISLPGLWLILGLLTIFVTSAGLFITLSAASSGVATQTPYPQRFVGVYTTVADTGAALGPILAFNLIGIAGFEVVYLSLAVLLLLAVLRFSQVERNSIAA